jgi:hypothetical protein
VAPIRRTEVDFRRHQRVGAAVDLSEDEDAWRGGLLVLRAVFTVLVFRGPLPRASGEVFHAVGDNPRELHDLLAQFGVFCNVALNAVAIGL